MFDLGWQEFILIAIITVIVVGPKDLPRVVRSISQWVRKARSMAREFQNSLEEVAREAELEDVRREVQSISKDGIGKSLEKQFDPDGSVRSTVEEARQSANADAEEIEADLKALDSEAKSGMSKSAPVTPRAAPAVETSEDYAAKSVAPPAQKTEAAAGTTTPAPATSSDDSKTSRPTADSAASGQG